MTTPAMYRAYQSHLGTAKFRSIPFHFTFEEWCSWWLTDNRWERRGRKSTDLCMGRLNDEGAYELSNVECITQFDNKKQITTEKRKASQQRGAASRRAIQVTSPDGVWPTRGPAAEFYGVSGATISYRIGRWEGWTTP